MQAAKAFFRSARTVINYWLDRVTTNGNGSYPWAIRTCFRFARGARAVLGIMQNA